MWRDVSGGDVGRCGDVEMCRCGDVLRCVNVEM